MIKREFFDKRFIKAVAMVAVLGASVALGGCASHDSTQAATVQTTQTQPEAESSLVTSGKTQSVLPSEEVEPEKDSEAPIINVSNGRIEVTEGDPIDLMVGVSALDGKDGDLTSAITASAVDVAVLGAEQLIKYSVVDASGNEATAEATLLIKADPIEVLDKTMYATAAVNVRSGSNKDTDKVSSLSFADSVKVTGKDKNTGWYQIKLSDGKIGYVSDKYFSDKKPSPKPVNKPSNTQTKPSGGSSSQSSKPSGGGSSKTKPSGGSGSSNSSKDSGSQNSDTGSSGTKPLPPIAPAQGGDRTGDGFGPGWG